MSSKQIVARNLSAAFLAGPWCRDGLIERGTLAWGRRGRWLVSLTSRVLGAFGEHPPRGAEAALAEFIGNDDGFANAWSRSQAGQPSSPHQVFWATPAMDPAPGPPASWQLPQFPTTSALGDWLGLAPKELDWFADCHGHEGKVPPGPLRHYTYRWVAKRGGKGRLLEMPKGRLKAIQRRLLHDLLDKIPPHDAVHSFRRGRSVATFSAPHAGRPLVLHLDLRDFFPSIPAARVHALFRTAGYPVTVARTLTGLCTNVVPTDVWDGLSLPGGGDWRQRQMYHQPHLPQGAPTSPALANLCAFRLDRRLAALARAAGAVYTRYADDLAFSGADHFERGARRFHVAVCAIALEEGFEVHTRKTRFMRQGVRQQLGGVVVNVRPNVGRGEYDQLKATLTNCARHGPRSQNHARVRDFRGHLAGRIAYLRMLNPSRGQRLQALFETIPWAESV
jgi:hypothetical protein